MEGNHAHEHRHRTLPGRRAHRALFSGFVKGTGLAEGDRPGAADLTKTYTLVREGDGHWRIAAFHNTQRKNVMERLSFLRDPATVPDAEK
ncbi:hypothetical protein [Streptomyces sp. NPDC059783]|uniref:hypothetical protein n=1 Tax=Streptomyces sp. NPDC059783 TaxID=3346944 RepID=UPI003662E5F3